MSRLEGWNHIPAGYGATFALQDAPVWVRAWHGTPFIDRYSYPWLVSRGYGFLRRFPGWTDEMVEAVGPGWQTEG